MIRAFAWWGISRSTSSVVCPFFSSSSRHEAAISVTARLNTSRPFGMRIRCRLAATVSGVAGSREPPPGIDQDLGRGAVGAEDGAFDPGRSAACTIAAPAPSPNRMQVCRSVKSRIRLNTSAPISSTVSAIPASTNRGGGRRARRRTRRTRRSRRRPGTTARASAAPTRPSREGRVAGDGRDDDQVDLLPRRSPAVSSAARRPPRPRDRRSRPRRRRSGGPRCPYAPGSTRPSCPPCPRTTSSEPGEEEGRTRRP